jgi:hypothetical protein
MTYDVGPLYAEVGMTAATATDRLLTTGEVAKRLGLDAWQVTRLIDRGLIAPPPKFGRYYVFSPGDLPQLRAAAVGAGYLDDPA